MTLGQGKAAAPVRFDRRANVGLHHLALRVPRRDALDAVYQNAADYPGVRVDFPPEPLGSGWRDHAMIFEPGGACIELILDPA